MFCSSFDPFILEEGFNKHGATVSHAYFRW